MCIKYWTPDDLIRYDTRCYFNVRSKADISQLSLPHGTTYHDASSGHDFVGDGEDGVLHLDLVVLGDCDQQHAEVGSAQIKRQETAAL